MENIGQYLKSIREDNHLTPEKVNTEIKLSLEQISHIENNRLTALGALGIARATVFTYIRYLNADEKKAMYLFDLAWPSAKQTIFTPKTPLKEKKVLISTNFIWTIAIILIVIILGSIIWVSWSKGYLKRPFTKNELTSDTLKSVSAGEVKSDKPDTLRLRMLQIANTGTKADENNKPIKSKKVKKTKISNADSTDYVNELLFQDKDSPFNQRF